MERGGQMEEEMGGDRAEKWVGRKKRIGEEGQRGPACGQRR